MNVSATDNDGAQTWFGYSKDFFVRNITNNNNGTGRIAFRPAIPLPENTRYRSPLMMVLALDKPFDESTVTEKDPEEPFNLFRQTESSVPSGICKSCTTNFFTQRITDTKEIHYQ